MPGVGLTTPVVLERRAVAYWTQSLPFAWWVLLPPVGGGGGGGGGEVYLESYTREARFLTRWDQHAVAQRRREEEEEEEEEFTSNRTRARRDS